MQKEPITIVSGLPRCGTSMMMKILDKGGIPVYIDNIREADIDNPGGYYELEIVKKIKDDTSWLEDAHGKVFKMVSMLLLHLPADKEYKVVFMQRQLDEMLASQTKMLKRFGKEQTAQDEAQLKVIYQKHLTQIYDWLDKQDHIDVHFVKYNDVLSDPQTAVQGINTFIGGHLNEEVMTQTVNPDLYRNKQPSA